MELKELLCLLEGRLVQHDNSRKEVQEKLQERCTRVIEDTDYTEEKINKELWDSFNSTEERILNLIEKLNEKGNDDSRDLIRQAQEELANEVNYEIEYPQKRILKSFADECTLKVSSEKKWMCVNYDDDNNNDNEEEEDDDDDDDDDTNTVESIVSSLKEHLDEIHESAVAVQGAFENMCAKRRREKGEGIRRRISEELERLFVQEDRRIQEVVTQVREKTGEGSSDDKLDDNNKELIFKAKAALTVTQKYKFNEHSLDFCELVVSRETNLEYIDLEERKPEKIAVTSTDKGGGISVSFTLFDEDEARILKPLGLVTDATLIVWKKGDSEDNQVTFTEKYVIGETEQILFIGEQFSENTKYRLKMKISSHDLCTMTSEISEFTSPKFSNLCTWKKPLESSLIEYKLDENNPRIAICVQKVMIDVYCTIIGNTFLPPNKVTSWDVVVNLSRPKFNRSHIYIGVVPFDIDQNANFNYSHCGWYLYYFNLGLYSGPPHNYNGKYYGPRRGCCETFKIGNRVGVVMDTTKGELSFIVNGVNLGVAYRGIPLDKPLVPCVLLLFGGDSVELDASPGKRVGMTDTNHASHGLLSQYCLIS